MVKEQCAASVASQLQSVLRQHTTSGPNYHGAAIAPAMVSLNVC